MLHRFKVHLAGCVLGLLHLNTLVSSAPEYQFSFGRITGVDEQAQDTLKPYYAYYGIPFAEPPVGNLRFRAPRPFSNRNDPNRVISSPRFRSACIQSFLPPSQISEDCLHLNVFTPTSVNSGGSLKKVMVWVHGGKFIAGRAQAFVPSRMVTDYDVIVVTVQYRVGMLGFLNPGSGEEANFGLRDQIEAARWVKDNIRQFGGDADDITIFGQSAGSACVSLLSLSPLAKGLFTKVITQSGVAVSGFATDLGSEDRFLRFADGAGCTTWLHRIPYLRNTFKDDILNCMRSKSAAELLTVQVSDGAPQFGGGDSSSADESLAPSVDGVIVPKHPEALLADKDYLQTNGILDRSYMVGFNNAEGLLLLGVFASSPVGGADIDYNMFTEPKQAVEYVKGVAKKMYNQPVTDDVMDFVEYEYTYPRGDQDRPDVMNVLNVVDDTSYAVPSVQFARAITTLSPSTPVYMYLFDHYPELINPASPLRGSTHGLETVFQFDRSPLMPVRYSYYAKVDTPTDRPLYNIVRNTWTQFAKTGRPSSQEYVSWPRFNPTDEFYMALSTSPELKQRVHGKRVDLWTRVLPRRAGRSFRSRSLRLY